MISFLFSPLQNREIFLRGVNLTRRSLELERKGWIKSNSGLFDGKGEIILEKLFLVFLTESSTDKIK